jgi:hypothetical protein
MRQVDPVLTVARADFLDLLERLPVSGSRRMR